MDIHVDIDHDHEEDKQERRENVLLAKILAAVTEINRFLHRPVRVQVPVNVRASVK